jgi:hypothetical protein
VIVPDNGNGTINFPPSANPGYCVCEGFQNFQIVDGLPPGTTIQIEMCLTEIFNVTEVPGGSLGGHAQTWNGFSLLELTGTGGLGGYSRFAAMQLQGQTHTAPRTPFDPVQSFATDLVGLQGQLPPGDPDFDLLRITAGTSFGMPSPGHTTLTQAGSNWAVDSFFDITYRIDFIGSPGGPLAGMSGSTTGTTRICLIPTPGATAVLAMGGLMAMRRRRG